MKKILSFGLMLTLVLAACNQSGKRLTERVKRKKSALEKLKKEQADRDAEIKNWKRILLKLDPDAERSTKIKLVAVAPVTTRDFKHFIDLQGKVDAENISFITPRGMPGQVKRHFVKEGQRVRKGQLLLKLDDAIVRQQVQAATQQLEGIKTQLGFARNIYQRQQNLWDKGIGTEVQLITAKQMWKDWKISSLPHASRLKWPRNN